MGEAVDEEAGRRQEALLDHFTRAGYARIDVPMLGPSSVFLDFSGEAIRSRLFLTSDGAGRELCLRPEFTIPVCRAYLDSSAGAEAAYCYAGPVFRSEGSGTGQVIQSGLESFGRTDTAAADAEILVRTLEAAADLGLEDPAIRMGDAGLLARLFDVLSVPEPWRRRLRRGLGRGRGLSAIFDGTPAENSDHAGMIAALSGVDQTGARALVEDLLSIAGIATVGGRTAAEIAERFLRQVATRSTPAFGSEQRQALERLLAIDGTLDDAAMRLRDFAASTGTDLSAALDLFDERVNFIAAQGIEPDAVHFAASFARDLDYYTGFTFEARHRMPAGAAAGPVVVGGGRYDTLAQALGSREAVPAVGASIFVERLARPEAADVA